MNRTIAFVLVSILTVGLFAGSAGADAAGDFEALFGAEAKKAAATRIKSDDVALAAKMLAAATGAPDSPKFQVLLYEKAYELGMKSKDGYGHAIEAVRRLAGADPERKDECEEKLLAVHNLQYRTGRGKERIKAGDTLSWHLQSIAEAQFAAGKTTEAVATYRKAHIIARAIRSKDAKVIIARINAIVARQRLDREAASLRQALKDRPDDKRVAKQLLMLLLVEKNDPEAAMAILPAADMDEATRTFVTLATKRWDDLPEETYLDLGAWYRHLARKTTADRRLRMLARARSYYETYLILHGKRDAIALRATTPLKKLTEELASAGWIDCGFLPPPKGVTRALAQWTRKRDAMPVKERLDALMRRLSEVNGGKKIRLTKHKIEGDRIVSLNLKSNKDLTTIGPLYGMKLQSLDLADTRVDSVEPLGGMKLRELNLWGCPNLRSVEGLQGMPLSRLSLYGDRPLESLEPLRGMPLTYLQLTYCGMKSLKGLEGMPLEELDISNCKGLEDIEALAGMRLRKLNVSFSSKIKDFKPLRGLSLTHLYTRHSSFRDITLLKDMPLRRLELTSQQITTLDPLQGMRLTWLSIGSKALKSLNSIEKMPLEYLDLRGTKFATKQVAEDLKKKIPTLKEVKIK